MNYLEILIAALAAFAIGAIWYTVLFGKYWQSQTGVTDEMARKNPALTHGLAFAAMLILGYFIQSFWGAHYNEDPRFMHGFAHAAMLGSIFAFPPMIINYAYQRRSIGLFLIDAAYIFLVMVVISGVISALTLYETPEVIPSLEEAQEAVNKATDALKEKQELLQSLQDNQ